jgi:hypothetical protein
MVNYLLRPGRPELRSRSVSYQFSESDIRIHNPYPAGQGLRIEYEALNTGPDDPGHVDHVDAWDHTSAKILDYDAQTPPVTSGNTYGGFVDVPPVQPGHYDLSITVAGTAHGSTTFIVQ